MDNKESLKTKKITLGEMSQRWFEKNFGRNTIVVGIFVIIFGLFFRFLLNPYKEILPFFGINISTIGLSNLSFFLGTVYLLMGVILWLVMRKF